MGFSDHVGIIDDDSLPEARVTTNETSENANGGVQGGLLATLLDVAMGRAVRLELDDDEQAVTVQLAITYLNGAKPGDELVARAQLLKRTKTLALITASVDRVGDDEHIAEGQATFAISSKD